MEDTTKLERMQIQKAASALSPMISVEAFMKGPTKVEWLLPDIVPKGSLMVLYGRPKSGKSIFALNLTFSLCTMGNEFLGRKSAGGRVGIIQLEDPATLVRQRITAMTGYYPEGFFISSGRAWGKEERDQLAFHIENQSLQLCIIDPLVLWKPGTSENSAEEMAELMYGLRQVVQLTGCTVLVVHHARKGQGDHGDNMRGSSAILGACDIALELRKGQEDGEATLKVVSRYNAVDDEALELDPVDLTWYSMGRALNYKVKKRRQEVYNLIRDKGPISPDDIRKRAKIGKSTLYNDLDYLMEIGKVEQQVGESMESGGRPPTLYKASSQPC